jgi:hypothetical protein
MSTNLPLLVLTSLLEEFRLGTHDAFVNSEFVIAAFYRQVRMSAILSQSRVRSQLWLSAVGSAIRLLQ